MIFSAACIMTGVLRKPFASRRRALHPVAIASLYALLAVVLVPHPRHRHRPHHPLLRRRLAHLLNNGVGTNLVSGLILKGKIRARQFCATMVNLVPDAIDFRRLGEGDCGALQVAVEGACEGGTRRADVVRGGGGEVWTADGEDSVVKAFIIVTGGAEVGYIQTYSIDAFPEYERQLGREGVIRVDLFLGDEWNTGHGLGAHVRRFVDDALRPLRCAACVAGPNEATKAPSARCSREQDCGDGRSWPTSAAKKGVRAAPRARRGAIPAVMEFALP